MLPSSSCVLEWRLFVSVDPHEVLGTNLASPTQSHVIYLSHIPHVASEVVFVCIGITQGSSEAWLWVHSLMELIEATFVVILLRPLITKGETLCDESVQVTIGRALLLVFCLSFVSSNITFTFFGLFAAAASAMTLNFTLFASGAGRMWCMLKSQFLSPPF